MLASIRKHISNEILFIFFVAISIFIFNFIDPTTVYKIYGFSQPFIHQVIPVEHRFHTFDDFLSMQHILILLTVYATTILLGHSLLIPFFRKISTNSFIKIFASFSIGYIASMGVIRVVSFVFEAKNVFFPTLASIVILSAFLIYKNRDRNSSEIPGSNRFILISIFTLLTLFFLCLLIQVYAGEFAWVGHGPQQYSWFLKYFRADAGLTKFPIISQHYDELLYTFFILSPTKISFNPILPMWVTLALNKVSFFALTYSVFRYLDVKTLASIVYSLFLLFGTSSIDPRKYVLLFDSANPIAYVVHSTRVVGISALFLIVANFLRPKHKEGFLNLPFFILIGLGIVFTVLSNYSSIVFVFSVIILFHLIPRIYRASNYNFNILKIKISPIILINLVFIGIAAGYGALSINLTFLPGIIHFTIFGFLVIFWGVYVLKNRKDFIKSLTYNSETKNSLTYYIVFIVSVAISSIFFANIFSNNIINKSFLSLLDSFTLFKGISLDNKIFTFATSGFNKSIKFFHDHRQLGIWSEYNKGFFYFLGYYGFVYILALFPHAGKYNHKKGDDFVLKWNALQLLMISILPLLFFHTDFFWYTVASAWIKSRFLELPIYLIIFTSMVLISRSTSVVLKKAILVFQIIYIVFPIISTMRLQQWFVNAMELLNFLK